MPLPTKTLREVAAELGMPEAEIRAMIDMGKIRAVFKKGTHVIAPDEIIKIKRERKTLPESSQKSAPAVSPPPIAKPAVKGGPPKKTPPPSMFGM
jgi:hypothetical protein